jgi:integrase
VGLLWGWNPEEAKPVASEKIPTQFPGVRFRYHKTRKYNGSLDKYFFIRYHVAGKLKEEGIGWASKDWNAKKASLELASLKKAQLIGEGPQTLQEKRMLAKTIKEAAAAELKRKAKENLGIEVYFSDKYFPASQAEKKKDSWRREKNLFDLWIKPVIGKMPFKDIRPLHMERIKKNMADAKKAPRSIQYALAVVRQIFNHAINNEFYVGGSPTRKVAKPKFDNKRSRFLTHEEAELLLKDLSERSRQLHDMALLSLHCGLRAGEIFDLRWGNVDVDHAIMILMDTKSGKNRTVHLTQKAMQVLENLPKGKPGDFVFTDKDGEKITDISNAFMSAVNKLKLNEGVTDRRLKVIFHTLRHTYASWLVQQGVDLYTVKELMGHSTLAMTERYSHLRKENLTTAVKKFEDGMQTAEKRSVAKIRNTIHPV